MAMTRLALRCIEYPAPDYLIAKACHISPAKFSQMQQGKRTISMNLALRLSAIFQVTPAEITGWAEESEQVILDDGVAV